MLAAAGALSTTCHTITPSAFSPKYCRCESAKEFTLKLQAQACFNSQFILNLSLCRQGLLVGVLARCTRTARATTVYFAALAMVRVRGARTTATVPLVASVGSLIENHWTGVLPCPCVGQPAGMSFNEECLVYRQDGLMSYTQTPAGLKNPTAWTGTPPSAAYRLPAIKKCLGVLPHLPAEYA